MRTTRTLMGTVALLACPLLFGCAEKRVASSPNEAMGTTSTTTVTSAEASRDQIAQLQRERDEARAALAEERSGRERERQREAADQDTRREYDELEMRVLGAMDAADSDMQTLRDNASRATAKKRKDIDKTLKDAQEQKAKLQADLKRLHGQLGTSWDAFRSDVEATIAELDRALSSVRQSDENKPQP